MLVLKGNKKLTHSGQGIDDYRWYINIFTEIA